MGRINCFIPFANAEQAAQTIQNLSMRVSEMPEEQRTADAFMLIEAEDIPSN